jgi:hypothetical protein
MNNTIEQNTSHCKEHNLIEVIAAYNDKKGVTYNTKIIVCGNCGKPESAHISSNVWIKASERLSEHRVAKCCRKNGHWFEAFYDKSIKMYVHYTSGTSSNRIPVELIEWLDEQIEVPVEDSFVIKNLKEAIRIHNEFYGYKEELHPISEDAGKTSEKYVPIKHYVNLCKLIGEKNKEIFELKQQKDEDWSELAKISNDPKKWLAMSDAYSDMLTKEDVAGWWQEQFNIANQERNELKSKIVPVSEDVEKAAEDYVSTVEGKGFYKKGTSDYQKVIVDFKAGAEWQKQSTPNTTDDVEKAAIKLNNACDTMWNTEGISRKVPENNIKEITVAQKELKIALEKQQSTPINEQSKIYTAIEILKGYETLEANIISENELWWPYRENDVLRGSIYDKFIELQSKRNEYLQSFKSESTFTPLK